MSEKPNFVYFDLETQKSAAEVGGWANKGAMLMSVGVTYSTHRRNYRIYLEEDVQELIEELHRADYVVGFNTLHFDYEVLIPYSVFDFSQSGNLDLIEAVEAGCGKRVGLDAIAQATLGVGKTAVGTDALQWWKEGRIHDIAEYCCFDVKTTMLVHQYGAKNGCIYYFDEKTKRREVIPVDWPG